MPTRVARRIALLALLGVVPGCSIIHSDSTVTYTGAYVPNDSLSRISIGESTPSYTEAILGTPTSKTDLEDGTSIWRWDYTESRSGHGGVLILLHSESSTSKKRSTYVQFEDGVAISKWRS